MDKIRFLLVAIAAIAFLWILGPSSEERLESKQQLNKILAEKEAEALPADPGVPTEFPKEKIRIKTQRGALPLIAGIANTPFNRRQGLMHYKQWPTGMHGLLFFFDQAAVINMWMKNTHLPLDMVFIDSEGKVVHIARNTTPLSEARVSSEMPARAVFEIPAGSAEKWQINVGDRFMHPFFASAE